MPHAHPGRRPDRSHEASPEIGDIPYAQAFPRRFVAPLFLGSTLNPINSSLIATALVVIAGALGVSVGRTSVLVSCLYLTSAVAQPTAGKLAEEFGARRIFLVGIGIVFAGGVVGGIGDDLATLVLARVLIGAGTSAGYPAAMVLIRRRATTVGMTNPPGSVLGGLAIAGQVTVAIGPTIGGLLVGWVGWRAAFLVNVPVTIAALAMALVWLPPDPPRPRGRSVRETISRIDLPGIAGFGGTMTSLLVFLMSIPNVDWVALAAAAVFAGALCCWELRARHPFLDLRLLAANRALTRTYLRWGFTLLGTYMILYGLTQWLEAAHGMSAEEAGLILIPMGALSALISQPISRRNLVRGPLLLSAVCMLLGGVAVLFLTSTSSILAIVGVTALFGLATGGTAVANQTALYAQAPPDAVGTAAGLLRTFGYLGSIASATITGIAFRSGVTDTGLHGMSYILIGLGVLVLLMSVLDRRLTGRLTISDEAYSATSKPNDAHRRTAKTTGRPPR